MFNTILHFSVHVYEKWRCTASSEHAHKEQLHADCRPTNPAIGIPCHTQSV